MDTKKLRQKILDLAIHGKLVPQDPNDEPASVLLERIKAEKERLIKEGKIKRSKKSAKTSDTPHYENVPFEVPEGWIWTTVNDVCSIIGGVSYNKVDIQNTGIRVLRGGNIQNGKIIDCFDDVFIPLSYQNNDNQVQHGDIIVVASTGSQTLIGKTGFADRDIPKTQIGAFLRIVRPKQKALSPYIRLIFQTDIYKDYIRNAAKGSNINNVKNSHLQNYQICLPPLEEQQRIVKEIERWFTLIDQIEQDKTDLQIVIKQAKNKILDLAIHGKLMPQAPNDEPAIELMKRINPDFIPCDNGHYPQLPIGWAVVPMQMLCSLVDGEKVDGKEMPNLDVKYLRGEREFKILKSGKYVAANSLLILVDGENSGEVFRTPIEGYQGSTFKQLHINENMCANYLLYVINLHRKALRENKVGSAIPHLDKKLFKTIEVPVPPYNEQVRIVTAINAALNRFDAIMENL